MMEDGIRIVAAREVDRLSDEVAGTLRTAGTCTWTAP